MQIYKAAEDSHPFRFSFSRNYRLVLSGTCSPSKRPGYLSGINFRETLLLWNTARFYETGSRTGWHLGLHRYVFLLKQDIPSSWRCSGHSASMLLLLVTWPRWRRAAMGEWWRRCWCSCSSCGHSCPPLSAGSFRLCSIHPIHWWDMTEWLDFWIGQNLISLARRCSIGWFSRGYSRIPFVGSWEQLLKMWWNQTTEDFKSTLSQGFYNGKWIIRMMEISLRCEILTALRLCCSRSAVLLMSSIINRILYHLMCSQQESAVTLSLYILGASCTTGKPSLPRPSSNLICHRRKSEEIRLRWPY